MKKIISQILVLIIIFAVLSVMTATVSGNEPCCNNPEFEYDSLGHWCINESCDLNKIKIRHPDVNNCICGIPDHPCSDANGGHLYDIIDDHGHRCIREECNSLAWGAHTGFCAVIPMQPWTPAFCDLCRWDINVHYDGDDEINWNARDGAVRCGACAACVDFDNLAADDSVSANAEAAVEADPTPVVPDVEATEAPAVAETPVDTQAPAETSPPATSPPPVVSTDFDFDDDGGFPIMIVFGAVIVVLIVVIIIALISERKKNK